jgi:hypothetical protein
MNTSPTLSSEDFGKVHNAKCEFHSICAQLDGILQPGIIARFRKAIALMDEGLSDAYKQDDLAEGRKSNHYDEVANEHGFKTIWSMNEVEDLRNPFAGSATHVVYAGYQNPPIAFPINGNTWVDLWRAAEMAIKASGDNHHIFIEDFIPDPNVPGVLLLSTGS